LHFASQPLKPITVKAFRKKKEICCYFFITEILYNPYCIRFLANLCENIFFRKKICCKAKASIFVPLKNSHMNKAELVAKLADDAGISKTQANAALDSFIEAVTKTLKGGGKVTLVGFGTFSITKRAARTGRNPQTGATIKIKAKKVAKFKAGKDLAEKL
jgi:DNA-binding protein HU-beta